MPHFNTQADTAAWMGRTVEQMNNQHDSLHRSLCGWAGAQSYSLMEAAGDKLTEREQRIAWAEEDAVLHVQRWLCVLRNEGAEATT